MDYGGGANRLAQQRGSRAFGHIRLHAVLLLEPEGVAGAIVDGGVTKNSGDGEQLDGGVGLGKQDGHGIVDARIGVENNLVSLDLVSHMTSLQRQKGGVYRAHRPLSRQGITP